ncbi:MAG: alpha/beta fold hydrolase [Bacteroidia bacterium]
MNLNYSDQGVGPALIMQHGLGGQLAQAVELGADLGAYRLICMDARGHGQTPYSLDHPANFDQYVDDLVAILDHLEIEMAIIGGVSMGAGISMNMALRYPSRVKALLLIRPAWLDQGRPESLEILRVLADYLDEPDGKARFAERLDFQALAQSLPNAAASLLGQFANRLPHRSDVLRRIIDDRPVHNLADLNKIELPSLIIASDDDPLHPYRFAERIHASIPQSLLQKVSSRYLDHDAHLQEVRQHLRDFLDKI